MIRTLEVKEKSNKKQQLKSKPNLAAVGLDDMEADFIFKFDRATLDKLGKVKRRVELI